jgi:hypothetical protein
MDFLESMFTLSIKLLLFIATCQPAIDKIGSERIKLWGHACVVEHVPEQLARLSEASYPG